MKLYRVQLLFFLSGATGLIYQVLWTRRLTLTFGHTALAVATVLTAFMGGLALGSLLAGRWADRRESSGLLKVYGWLEGFIGCWALVTLPLLTLVERGYVQLASEGWAQLACFAGAAAVLIPPTTAMGATLPVLTRFLTENFAQLGPILSRLYGLNTLGALAGAAASGFYLLPTLGLQRSLGLAVALNLAIAAVAVLTKTGRSRKTPRPEAGVAGGSRLVLFTLGVGGLASMAYQVAWTRALALSIGSSTYAFTTILVTFLGGLGLGSLAFARLAPRSGRRDLSRVYLGIALFGGLTIPAAAWLPWLFHRMFGLVKDDFAAVVALDLGLAGLLLLPPTFLMGLAFPLATAVYAPSLARLGRSVGELYSANTLGCIVGAFVTGFVLVPHFGAQWALKAATLAYLTSALVLMPRWLPLVAVMAGLTLALPAWNTGLMSAGVAIYASQGIDLGRLSSPAFYRDGLSSTVSMHYGGYRFDDVSMRVNGKADASTGRDDRQTQYLLGYIPLLVHPEPQRALIIGLGGGFTVEAAAAFPGLRRIDCVELEPAVVEAGEYWRGHNGNVLDDPRVTVHVTDGRTFVLGSSERYDVIVSEPSNPWIAGVGNLFTRDFYRTARDRLTENGVMCQWFNLYGVSLADVQMVLRGFYETFPHGQVWQTSSGDLALLGSRRPLTFSLERVRRMYHESPTLARHFFEIGLFFPESLTGHYLGLREDAVKLAGAGPHNTDDHPLLEFSAPLSLYRDDQVWRNTEFLWSRIPPSLPPGCDPEPGLLTRSLFGVINTRRLEVAEVALRALEDHRSPEGYAAAALVAELRERSPEPVFNSAFARFPQDPLVAAVWGDWEFSRERWARAAELYLLALMEPPTGARPHLLLRLGESLSFLEDHERAMAPLLQASEANPASGVALALAGHSLVALQRDQEAVQVLEQALARDPWNPHAYLGLAYARFNTGQTALAEQHLLKVLQLAPHSTVAWLKLGFCRRALGDEAGSRAAFLKVLELEPEGSVAKEALEL